MMPLCKRNRPVESPPPPAMLPGDELPMPVPDEPDAPSGLSFKTKAMIGGGILLWLFLRR